MPKTPLTTAQLRKLKKIASVVEKGNAAILEYLFEIEEKMEKEREEIESKLPALENIIEKIKGKDANPKEVANLLKQDKSFIQAVKPEDGSDYILTDDDITEIARRVPPVEKVIEKREIIREVPIVTNNVTNEIVKEVLEKEVAVLDEATVAYLENKIETLEDEVKKLQKQKGSTNISGGIIGRDMVKDYDLSSQLDGVTKTFSLPAVWNVIAVDTSSVPHALRKGIDYTWTQTSITFTDQIDAATTLAAGQTVILTIVS